MSSAPTADEIWRDATWLAQALDPRTGLVRLVAMDRESYRSASFLDDRLLQSPVDAHVLPWREVEASATDNLRRNARWIFHIGHVGSTLVSRLLGEIEGVLAIREPRLLRDLAISPPMVRGRYLKPIASLMSRTFDPSEITCVKATSFASEIAQFLVPSGERALFMYATLRNYVASILAGENSVKELNALADFRRQRLNGRGITFPAIRNDAELAAAAWACEMTTLEVAAEAMSDRQIAWLDFDVMLGNITSELGGVASFFGFAVSEERLATITGGPLMQHYSKDLSYDYSPQLRDDLIAQEMRLRGPEIDAALAMLHQAADKAPLLQRALHRSTPDD
jgi:hypothetical protein